MQRAILYLLAGLVLGAAIGAGAGWLFPVQETTAGFDRLHPDYQADYTVMVAEAYAANGDLALVEARLARLGVADPGAHVAGVATRYLDEGRSPDDIRALVRLAVRYGAVTPAMQPYIAPAGDGP